MSSAVPPEPFRTSLRGPSAALVLPLSRLAQLQKLLREQFRGVTKLVIAHRLSSVLDADSILVMGAGRVLEIGAPETLLADANSQLSRMQASAVI